MRKSLYLQFPDDERPTLALEDDLCLRHEVLWHVLCGQHPTGTAASQQHAAAT